MDPQKTPAAPGESNPSNGGAPLDLSRIQAKRGRGRPRTKSIDKAATAAHAEKPAAGGEAAQVLDAAFISESACCLIEVVDEVIARTLADRMAKIDPSKLAEFVKLQQTAGFNEKDRQMVDLSVNAMAKKHEFLTKFGPEIFFLAWGSQYAVRQARLMKFVNEIAKARAKMQPAGSPTLEPRPNSNVTPFPAAAVPASN